MVNGFIYGFWELSSTRFFHLIIIDYGTMIVAERVTYCDVALTPEPVRPLVHHLPESLPGHSTISCTMYVPRLSSPRSVLATSLMLESGASANWFQFIGLSEWP